MSRLRRPQIPMTTHRDTPTVTRRSEDSLIVQTRAHGNALELQLSTLLLCQPVANSFSLLFIITASSAPLRAEWKAESVFCTCKTLNENSFWSQTPSLFSKMSLWLLRTPIQRCLPDESGGMCLSSAVNAEQKKSNYVGSALKTKLQPWRPLNISNNLFLHVGYSLVLKKLHETSCQFRSGHLKCGWFNNIY